MPVFKYKGRDRSGKVVVGSLDAPTLQVAGDHLYQQGYYPTAIEEEKESPSLDLFSLLRRFRKVGLEDVLLFSQQLSTLYKAGLPLLTALTSLKEQTEDVNFKQVIGEVCHQIEGGSALFEAMSRYPRAFSSVYRNMVRAGEATGKLGDALDRFVILEERGMRTRQKVKEATRYPKLVIASLILAFGVLITFVIPRFAQIFAQFKTPLPLPTRVMIGVNTIFQNYWYLILSAFLGVPILLRYYLRTPKGRSLWDRLKIRIPLFGPLFLKVGLSRFAYTFVMLNQSGVPILQTLEITSKTLDNSLLSRAIEKISQRVQEGWPLAEAMKESGRFTPMVIQMVSIGESTGTIDTMLTRVTEYYDIEVENGIKKLSAYIEPILTLFLATAVLFLALAVFLPWWNLASLFR